MDNIDITSIINNTSKDFTRKRASKIKEYLLKHNDCVVFTELNKARGASIKFYYITDGDITTCEYVKHNADTLFKAFENKGVVLKNSKEL